jgi:hypothetical protein
LISTTIGRRLKHFYFGLVGLMAVAVLGLSLLQVWILSTADIAITTKGVQVDERGLPPADKRGVFLALKGGASNPLYMSNLVELLATNEPGVIDEERGGHFAPNEIERLLIQSAVISRETSDYRVYRIGVEEKQKFKHTRQPGGKVLFIEPEAGRWEPGSYLIDIPAEGMFGGRTYFQFYVDNQQ